MKVLIVAIISSLCVSSFAMNINGGGPNLQELLRYITNNPTLLQMLLKHMQMSQQQQPPTGVPTSPSQQPSQGSQVPAEPNMPNQPAVPTMPNQPALPSMPNQPAVPNAPNMNANSNALGMSLAQRMALAALMKPRFYFGQRLPAKGFFPGGVVISADGSDATVRGPLGNMSIDGYNFCLSEFNCVRVM